MNLDPFKHPEDVAVAIRDELLVVSAILEAAAKRSVSFAADEQAAALTFAADDMVRNILEEINSTLAQSDAAKVAA